MTRNLMEIYGKRSLHWTLLGGVGGKGVEKFLGCGIIESDGPVEERSRFVFTGGHAVLLPLLELPSVKCVYEHQFKFHGFL